MEGDTFSNFLILIQLRFQSTPSVWRETSGATRLRTGGKNFNPLPPCGGRRSSRRNPPIWIAISIHSLRVEGDERTGILTQLRRKFQSTPSVWRETPTARPPSYNDAISIHSLRVEGDFLTPSTPRLHRIFQSTPSVWRETYRCWIADDLRQDFNPLPPCGGRHGWTRTMTWYFRISIHSLRVEGDRAGRYVQKNKVSFQSTPSVWRETAKLHSFPLKTQQSKCNFDKKEHRYTSPCQKKYFFSDFFTKKRVRIPPAFFVRLGFAPERFLRTKAVPPHRWFPLRRYVPLLSDTDSPDSRTGGYPSRYRWHPSAAV